MKTWLHAISASFLLHTAAQASPLTVALEGSLSSIKRTVYTFPSGDGDTKPPYAPVIYDRYDDTYGGLSLGDQAVFTFQVEPGVPSSPYATVPFSVQLHAGAISEIGETYGAHGEALATSLGVRGDGTTTKLGLLNNLPGVLLASVTFAPGSLNNGSSSADYLHALADGKLSGAFALLSPRGDCSFLYSCTDLKFTIGKVSFAADGVSVSTVIPEPSTIALMCLGMAAVLLARARPRRHG